MDGTTFFAVVIATFVAYVAIHQWMRHHRRIMVHRERLAAVEKGLQLPPSVEDEVQRGNWNVQRLLLLAGLSWISIGIGVFIVLSAVLANPSPSVTEEVPQGMQWIGVPFVGIGLSHLVVYAVGKSRERQGRG